MNPFAGQQRRHRHREQTYEHGGRGKKERMGQMERVTWEHRQSMGICYLTQGTQSGAL